MPSSHLFQPLNMSRGGVLMPSNASETIVNTKSGAFSTVVIRDRWGTCADMPKHAGEARSS